MRCRRRWIALPLALGWSCCRRIRLLILFLLGPVLVSCGGGGGGDGGGGSVVTIQGNAQKGPFINGSSIQVFPLNASLVPTGAVFSSQISNDLGFFRVTPSIDAPFVEVVANGLFYDELATTPSRLSSAPLTLRALAPAGAVVDLRVNVLTTLLKTRLERLVGQGIPFSTAALQARDELLAVFGLPGSTLDDPARVDVTQSGQGDAALIAISATLLQRANDRSVNAADRVANLALTLSQLGTDFQDGTISTENRRDLALAARRVDAQAVRANLQAILASLGLTGPVPDIAPQVAPLAAQYPWQAGVPLPLPRMHHAACAVNGKIYVMGGFGNAASGIGGTGDNVPNNELRMFDPASPTWTSRAPMPTARSAHTCAVVNGRIYAIGGIELGSDSAKVQEYDPATNSWASKASMPTARWGMCSAVVGDKIYVMGGANAATTTAEEYDPATNTWKSLTPMPAGTWNAACGSANGLVYVIGGIGGFGPSGAIQLDAVNAYDPGADTWSAKAAMPTARSGLAIGTVAGKFYAIGGSVPPPAAANNEEYDPSSDAWVKKASLVYAVDEPEVVAVGGVVYVIGGDVSTPGGTAVNRVELYDPAKD